MRLMLNGVFSQHYGSPDGEESNACSCNLRELSFAWRGDRLITCSLVQSHGWLHIVRLSALAENLTI